MIQDILEYNKKFVENKAVDRMIEEFEKKSGNA